MLQFRGDLLRIAKRGQGAEISAGADILALRET